MTSTPIEETTAARQLPARALPRLTAFIALTVLQAVAISFLFYFPTGLPEWANPVSYAKKIAQFTILAAAAFFLVAHSRRAEILRLWKAAIAADSAYIAMSRSVLAFAVLVIASVAFSSHAAASAEPPWSWFALYCALLVANACMLALVAAPTTFWLGLPRLAATEIVLALSSAGLILLAGQVSRSGWVSLSSATLNVSAWMLSLFESNVEVDTATRMLAVGDFRVIVTSECSGYEGIGLVVAFLALYFWLFRSELKFPNVLLLVPLGIGAIWILNAVRIAALVSIGAHLSPAVATDGFHSQAGWIAFLAVSLGIIGTAHSSNRFRKRRETIGHQSGSDRPLLAFLLPFIALMASSIAASAFAPNDQWLYALKVAAVGTVLWLFRDIYLGLASRVSPVSIAAGIAVGIVWIVTDPLEGQAMTLGTWIYGLPPALAVLWIFLRAFGSILLVPLAEELAFRGYLHRALIARRFTTVPQGQFTWMAFVVSTILFGLIHQRWLAAMFAGAVYAMVMYRTGRLADPIAAHMASNAAIVLWAIVAHQWSLL